MALPATKINSLKRRGSIALVPPLLEPPAGLDAQAEIFDFQVVFDAVLGAFTAQARGLDAAERRHFVGDQPGVDACLLYTSDAADDTR